MAEASKGLALSVRRQHSRVGAILQEPAGKNDVHPTRERKIRVTPLQAGDRLVGRHERRRARGIHRHRRPPEAQRVGDSADRGVERRTGDRIETGGGLGGPGVLARLQDESPVVVVADPRVDAGAAAPEPLGIDARVFERPPARLQNQPLLRVQQVIATGAPDSEDSSGRPSARACESMSGLRGGFFREPAGPEFIGSSTYSCKIFGMS